MTPIEILVSIMGIVMSLGHFPQAYTIYKNKSSKNISLLTYIIFAIGSALWLAYGILLNSWTIILGFIFGVVGSWLVLILTIVYSKKK